MWNVYLILISLLSNNIVLSLESSLFYFRFGFFSLAIWYAIDTDKNFLKNIHIIFSLVFLFIIIDGYIQFFYGQNIFGFEYDRVRLSGIFGDEKILGSFLSRMIPIFFGLSIFLYSKNKMSIILPLTCLVILDILIYITGERAAFFNLILFSVIIIIFTHKWKMIRAISLIISFVLIFFISYFNNGIYDRMITKTLDQTNVFEGKVNAFSIQHEVVYQSAFKMFRDNPIFGIGPKMFRETCKEKRYQVFTDEDLSIDGCQTHPHNFMLQLLTESGIIGAIPVVFVFLTSIYVLLRNLFLTFFKKIIIVSDVKIIFISSIIINLWPLVPTGNFFNNYLSILIYFPLGFLMYFVYSKK